MFRLGRKSASRAPKGLKSCDLDGIVDMIRRGLIQRIAFLTGAGISVSAGIPDFRSPGGMYDTLRPDLLTASEDERSLMRMDPTAVVSWTIFARNQFPYLELRRPFILGLADGIWKPTLSHYFMRVCEDKKLLVRLYTQNIDGLDYPVGIPEEKIVPVHGTMGRVGCEFCNADYPVDEFKKKVSENVKDIYGKDAKAPKESSHIRCLKCSKPGVKPRTVLYGGSLPQKFWKATENDFEDTDSPVDLLIIVGTSLTVSPANSVVNLVSDDCMRLVVNREPVGEDQGIDYGESPVRDVFGKGNCDDVFLELATKLGWLDDLKKYSGSMAEKSVKALDAAIERSKESTEEKDATA